jgi:16S rRNA (cytidine1402-2'-O)-methyltransferase
LNDTALNGAGASPKVGTLYLIPTHLTEPTPANTAAVLPPYVTSTAAGLTAYIAENAKTARAFLKAIGATRPISEISIVELDKHAAVVDTTSLLKPLLNGIDVGLVSEAGAPAVADPGAVVVAAAHAAGIRVVPLVGPSSILLALMASGLNGQRFAFHGYLPQEKGERHRTVQLLEKSSSQQKMTQMVIETPYRNTVLLADLTQCLSASTRLCVATDVTGANERIRTLSVADWKRQTIAVERLPTLFLFLAQ